MLALIRKLSIYRYRGWIGLGIALLFALLSIPSSAQRFGSQVPAAFDHSPLNSYCQQSAEAIARKEQLRQQAGGSDAAWAAYTQMVAEHRRALSECRQRRWPPIQAIWLRLYACDANPGALEKVLDRIVNLGYNRVFIETFYDGRVILPQGDPWPSILPSVDLLDQALTLARRRGLSAYAWLFSLNFGYSYGERPDRQAALARNGSGNTTILDPATASLEQLEQQAGPDQVFVDPFHPQARQDYARLVEQVLARRPDGILFDYIRYPRSSGSASVASNVKDLWIHGEAAAQAFRNLGSNPASQALLDRYRQQGYITTQDVLTLDQQFPDQTVAWRPADSGLSGASSNPSPSPEDELVGDRGWALGNASGEEPLDSSPEERVVSPVQRELVREASPAPTPSASPSPSPTPSAEVRQATWQPQLWQLAVDFARFGILDFLRAATSPAQTQGIPAGAVFFPDANASVQSGYDSRLQPWDQFDAQLEWHVMAYAKCEDASCVAQQVQRVIEAAPAETLICPALAGLWGQSLRQRPMLEVQMQTLQQQFPRLTCVSHFAYSWIEPQIAQERQRCQP
ncbi:MAG: hypothetical protein NW237_16360 [Cyanobacteriota bacterium]|nr:hypothetical protein [Cyanobacteriota bacterium]